MSFNEGADLDTSQVSGGGGRGGAIVGGGVGTIVLLILGLVFGGGLGGSGGSLGFDPSILTDAGGGGDDLAGKAIEECRTGADANRNDTCRVVGTVNSVQDYWTDALPADAGREYVPARTVVYSGQTQSACGTASNAVGPFYCPADQQVYIDASFFDELTSRFGADGGALAQMYVVAHEYGHHVQDLLGVLDAAQRDPRGAESGGVRVELMADCLAGVWAHHAAGTRDSDGDALIQPLTRRDVESALSAAAAVGDDRIQRSAGQQVDPEGWTHGSSEQRQRWFTRGYESGTLDRCNTLNARDL